MKQTILITGSAGLVGRKLSAALTLENFTVKGFDLKTAEYGPGDIRNPELVGAAVEGCVGVVHLAAVSRVVWGQRDPELCWQTNVGGVRNLLQAISAQERKPWIVFASSREVYGQPEHLPAGEDTPLNPVNVYARSKAEGERLVQEARVKGLQTAIVRLSNVFGCTHDHADRVVPAFARAAATGDTLRVEGSDHTFDFTHVDDVVRGICKVVTALQTGRTSLPPIQFVTGHATNLGRLADLATRLAESNARIEETPPRTYDVAHFYGDPSRARELLGWAPSITLEDGLRGLIEAFRTEFATLAPAGAPA